ncbi:flagellin [Geobacillus sp. FSL K6-0789]|uniref:Flagellin n=1 Tax=Geobacillus stearothermophilus TaxID=1422 RepID=A0A3L7CMS8_GEOSE|nr:flagellin [Geobacillus stearothermophilus]RLQ05855.1 flagellin protein [Geobacillus stearothermophilus]RLQ06841.1 flagellin protein [Geobacillus stearothermophilus]RLQ13051.1 flagellin protein [Geobacillus stearothermophilus]
MRINHNIAALNTYRQLTIGQNAAAKNMERLSSGLRINRAGDDAAGLAISEKMRGQIRGLEMAARNAQDGISLLQTAEGALNETHSILQRMRELAVQAANGTATDADRAALQDELNNLTSEINRIGNTTEFNTQKLLNGGIGSNESAKITQARSASITGTVNFAAQNLSSVNFTAKIKVDNTTFDVTSALKRDWTGKTVDDVINALNEVTSGGTKLSDLVNLEKVTSGGNTHIKFTAKSEGATSSIDIILTGATDDVANVDDVLTTGTTSAVGSPTTMERAGVESALALDKMKVVLGGTIDTDSNATGNQLNFASSGATSNTKSFTINSKKIDLDKNYDSLNNLIADVQSKIDKALGSGKVQVVANSNNDGFDLISLDGADITISNADTGTGLTNGSSIIRTRSSELQILSGDYFEVTVGSDSAVKVNLNTGTDPKKYDVTNADANVAKAEMERFVKDINAALQEAGLSDKVTAALSKDNKLQFISETGKDITINVSSDALKSLGESNFSDVKNVQQVVGPGAQGSGYTTKFQIGANTGQSMSLTINDMRAAALGITGNAGQAGFTSTNTVTNGTNDIKTEAALNISNKEDASRAIVVIDKAIQTVSAERGKLGAVQNRLEHTINNLGTASENLTAAESRIRDVDYALAA